jgi:hypothetical protein
MRTGILLFEQFYGKEGIGSSRIRGHWIAKHWKEYGIDLGDCEAYLMGQEYDAIIYQKVYWIEHAKDFKGIKILDMCDPDFLHWGYRVKEMVDLCDAVTTSTEALAEFMRKYTEKQVICVPDRMDLESFGIMKKVHTGKAEIAGWFGYSENFPMLDQTITSVIRTGFDELLIIANQKMPYQLPAGARDKIRLNNIAWSQEYVNRDLLGADVILNPTSAQGKWKYKSNNKTLTAWALGLPVANTDKELEMFMDAEARTIEGDKRYAEVREKWHVGLSVEQYKNLIASIKR